MIQLLEAIVGLEAGDEGKGKIVDERVIHAQALYPDKRTIVVRFQGGPNAGHTINIPKLDGASETFITHSAPSGLASNADIAIGPSVAFDPEKFLKELKEAQKLSNYNGRIMISERAGILFDYHRRIDAHRESSSSGRKIDTTKSGIGPFYEDNARRLTRITFHDYISTKFYDRLKEVFELKKHELEEAGIAANDYLKELIELHEEIRRELAPFAENLEYRLREYLVNGNNIIIEGAQGTMLDVDMGTIPEVTSSHLIASHAFASLGLPRVSFEVYGVEKVYPTRVGNGILPTLSTDGFGETVAERAKEFGATTGRKRRVGYPDWVFIRRSAFINDCDGIFLTRVDNVQDLELKVCAGYLKTNGKVTDEVPFDLSIIESPLYLPKIFKWHLWNESTGVDQETASRILRDMRASYVEKGFTGLPSNLLDFVSMHDKYVGCPIVGIGIGPHRGETITKLTIP